MPTAAELAAHREITPRANGTWQSRAVEAGKDHRWWVIEGADGEATAPPLVLDYKLRESGPASLAVVAELGGDLAGWILRATMRAAEPGPDFDLIELRRGPKGGQIGSRRLRGMGLGDVIDGLTRVLQDPRADVYLGAEWSKPLQRPGRRGTDARVYAVTAARYVRALRNSPRAPYKAMVDEAATRGEYETEVALRAAVRRARQLPDPVLTPATPGRAGGELTELGKRLAREMGEEV